MIYHAALEASCDITSKDGTYETWEGSLAQQGRLQHDIWDWASLKEKL